MLKTAEEIISDRLNDLWSEITTYAKQGDVDTHPTSANIHDAFTAATNDLIDAFGWHSIEHADAFDLRTVRAGHRYGPRVIVMLKGDNEKAPAPYIAYWDPDTEQHDGRPVARPKPYWRTVGMTAGWSRRNQPTHFIRPYAPSFDR